MDCLFSVIIPTYNRGTLLLETLRSVFGQTFTDYEVIVVDDGSTDETESRICEFNERIQFLRQPNRGPGAARNLGLHHAAGKYVAFLDSDDLWFPWSLDIYARVIEQVGNPCFIAGKPQRFAEPTELESIEEKPLEILEFQDYFRSGDHWRWWGVSSFVVMRESIIAVGGFTDDWINGEDADLAMRLGEAQGFVQITAPATFGYREHAESAMKNGDKTLAGVRLKIRSEVAGGYPGGPHRARERWRILTRHIRPVSLDCLRQGMRNEAWELYFATLRWHLSLRKWKYLAGFPLKALIYLG